MGFLKGNDSRARTLLNPLEGEVGDADLTALTLVTLSASGNITGSYLIGNGSQLTGVVASSNVGSASKLSNGTTEFNIPAANGNVVGNIGGVANVYQFGSTGMSVAGNIAGNFILGNGSQLTGIVATSSYGNANVVANLAALGSNPVSTTGNISANYVFGNGSQLTGLPATYGNANVVANLAALGSNPVSTTGNVSAGNLNVTGNIVDSGALTIITGSNGNIALAPNGTGIVTASGNISAVGNIAGNFILGNGSQLTGIVATSSYGNANVVANIAALGSNPVSTTGNVSASNLNVTGNIVDSGALSIITGSNGNIALAPNGTGIVTASGNISAVGNIAGNYFVGNGSQLTGVVAVSNVGSASKLSNGTTEFNIPAANGNVVGNIGGVTNVYTFASTGMSVAGNVTANYILGNGSQLTGITANYGNANVANYLESGDVFIIDAGFFIGDGGSLTNLPITYGNSNVVANLAALGTNPVSTTGNVTAANFLGAGAGTPTISSTGNLDLSAPAAVRVIGGGTFRLPSLTTAQVANIVAANGDMIYNTTTSKIQAYANGAWGNITLT